MSGVFTLGRIVRPVVVMNATGKTLTVEFERVENDRVVLHIDRPGMREIVLPASRAVAFDYVVEVTDEDRKHGLKRTLHLSVVAHVTVAVAPRSGPVSLYYLYLRGNEEARARVFRLLEDEPLAFVFLSDKGPPEVKNSVLLNKAGQTVFYSCNVSASPDLLQTRLVV